MSSTQTRRIADRYELIEPLGQGGMGVVWLAEDRLLARKVAVKEIEFPSGMESVAGEAVKARAVREARSAARLSHTGVVTIYDVVQEERGAFIVMEYVDSPTLAEIISENGPLAPQHVARVGLQILEALNVAHAAGVVHRDVKPGNIMVTTEDRVKLADFGIASVKDDPKITSTGMVLGSPQFMAPEQANGSGSDAKTDLWALGATLYYAVEGELPFDRGRPIPTLAAVVHDHPRAMKRADALEPVVLELLAKDPARRPDGVELAARLEKIAKGSVSTIDTGVRKAAEAPTPKQPPAPVPVREPRPRRPKGALLALVAILAVAGLIALVGPALIDDDSPDGGRSSSPRRDADGRGDAADQNSGGSSAATGSWESYTDDATGYSLRYPPGWGIARNGTLTDFRDPETGTYLRVDWTDSPGRSPEEAWRELAADFAEDHADYSEIGITPTTYKGYDAAIWEFTYSEQGANLHAADLGFVTDDFGFALYFQSHAERWESSQALFDRFKASFQVPD